MSEELDLDKAMTPEQVREAREQYVAQYGDDAFQPVASEVHKEATPPSQEPITARDIPAAPFIEPEAERTMTGAEAEELRRQYFADHPQDDTSGQK